MAELSPEVLDRLLSFQRTEITEYHVYSRLARRTRDEANRRVIERIAQEEREHYELWREYTGREVKPNRLRAFYYYLVTRLLGFTFGLKLMERGEESAQEHYQALSGVIPDMERIIAQENEHEQNLMAMLDEERLRYMGSIVLGLNDALVELTGALAGLTLALQNARLIALTGLITGIAAALSMAASEYLSTKSEETVKSPLKASVYTGAAYLITVVFLILPYLLLGNYFLSLAITLFVGILIIAFFNFYLAVAKDQAFGPRFLEMALLSLGVAGFSFLVGMLLRQVIGVDV
jgi:VIT1/CCC1 family predicted Fe2+/Mn2+ transporter